MERDSFGRSCGVALVSVFVFAAAARAAAEGPFISRRALFADPDRGAIKLSPDGTRIGYLAPPRGASSLFIAPLADVAHREQITKESDGPIVAYEWAYTANHVVFVKPVGEGTHVFVLDLRTRETRDLTPGNAVSAEIAKLSPQLPDEVLVTMNGRRPDRPDLYRVDLRTGAKRLVLRNPGYDRFLTDNHFRPRVGIREASDGGYELSSRDAKGNWKVLFTIPLAETIVSRPVAVDGEGTVLYVIDNQNQDKAVLKSIDLKTAHQSVLLSDPHADLGPALMLHPRSGRAESATAAYGRIRRLFLNRSLAKDFDVLRKVAPGDDVGIAGRSADDKVWLVVFFNGGPARYYAYDRITKRATYLTTEYDALERLPMAKRTAVEYTTRDGIRLPGDLYLPSWVGTDRNGRPDVPLPTVLVVHGGPSVAYPWNSWSSNRMLQLLADRGYLAFRVEFRGTGGLGKTILRAGDGEWGRKMNDDLLDAASWAVANGLADRSRIGVMGWSYGGYATVAGLTFTPDAFACGVAMYPVTDLAELLRSRDEFERSSWRELVGDERTEEGRALLHSRSPVHFAERITAPLLITHGVNDRNVAVTHSEREVEAMRRLDKQVIYLRFADEGHDYAIPRNLEAFFGTVEAFLQSSLHGRAEPIGSDLELAKVDVAAGRALLDRMTAATAAEAARRNAVPPG